MIEQYPDAIRAHAIGVRLESPSPATVEATARIVDRMVDRGTIAALRDELIGARWAADERLKQVDYWHGEARSWRLETYGWQVVACILIAAALIMARGC